MNKVPFLSAFCLGLTACAAPYIAGIPTGNAGFSPEVLSGDGKVVVGSGYPAEGLWAWTRGGGLMELSVAPPGSQTFPAATSYDGRVVVGRLLFGSGALTGIFLWTPSKKFLLGPISPSPAYLSVSNDGQTIIFSCSGDSSLPGCRGSGFSNRPSGITLTQDGAYEPIETTVKGNFNVILGAADSKIYLVGINGTETQPASLGLLDASCHYTPFADVPKTFDPEKFGIATNSAMTIIVFSSYQGSPMVWNSSGQLIHMRWPQECTNWNVNAVDDKGAVFGSADCPQYNVSPGICFRITSDGAQTIGEWLRNNGVPNNLVPNSAVLSVSRDGKTVLGINNIPPVATARNDFSNIPKLALSSFSQESDGQSTDYFIAHVR